jgi:hypothetical protein
LKRSFYQDRRLDYSFFPQRSAEKAFNDIEY